MFMWPVLTLRSAQPQAQQAVVAQAGLQGLYSSAAGQSSSVCLASIDVAERHSRHKHTLGRVIAVMCVSKAASVLLC
jgi:hypothetical protein